MNKYTIYIGSDNTTGKVDHMFAHNIISNWFKSYTYQFCAGVWNGKHEETMKVEIATDNYDNLYDCCMNLKTRLEQESIMLCNSVGEVIFI